MAIGILFLWIFILILVARSIKIASETQRFIIYRLGRFFGLKGPGLVFIIPGVDKCVRISVGDRGELLAQGLARVKGADIPVRVEGRAEIGKMVRIQSFAEKDTVVVADSVQTQEFLCEKCGPINRV
jgi:regulator of protease activity HflC (stomatin/prohibitin superfamily)